MKLFFLFCLFFSTMNAVHENFLAHLQCYTQDFAGTHFTLTQKTIDNASDSKKINVPEKNYLPLKKEALKNIIRLRKKEMDDIQKATIASLTTQIFKNEDFQKEEIPHLKNSSIGKIKNFFCNLKTYIKIFLFNPHISITEKQLVLLLPFVKYSTCYVNNNSVIYTYKKHRIDGAFATLLHSYEKQYESRYGVRDIQGNRLSVIQNPKDVILIRNT